MNNTIICLELLRLLTLKPISKFLISTKRILYAIRKETPVGALLKQSNKKGETFLVKILYRSVDGMLGRGFNRISLFHF